MDDILERILAVKREEVKLARSAVSLEELKAEVQRQAPARGFARAMQQKVSEGRAAVISEVKKASPSKGLIRADFRPAEIAADYERNGAACLSVLTDRQFFMGSREALLAARAAVSIPILRKDFLVDPYQVYEARAWGADAVLIIMRAVDDALASDLAQTAFDLGMDVLVETHDEEEIERALKLPAKLIGINNRNLRTFETSIEQTIRLRHLVPEDRIVVTESGVHDASDVARLRGCGVNCFLVGEAFMRAPSPGAALNELFQTAELVRG